VKTNHPARAASRWLGAAFLALVWASPLAAQRQDTTKLPPGVELETRYSKRGRPLIAVRRFTGPIPFAGLTEQVSGIVANDLTLSDRFEILPVPESMVSSTELQYDAWNSLNVIYLVTGEIVQSGEGFQLRLTAHDVVYGREKQSGTFALPPTSSNDFRLAVHAASDGVVQWVTGQPGTAATRIAFVRLNQNGSFDLLTVDSDGENLRRVFGSPSQIYSPAWSPDGTRIAYAAREPDGWRLVERDLATGRIREIEKGRDAILTPAYSNDGRRLAYAIWVAGGYEIHDYDLEKSCCARRLTDSGGDNISPSYSPEGSRMTFLSTRTGKHHIFVMGTDGSNPRILTPFGEGVEFNAPEWSPVGSRIALWGASRGTFQLMTMDADRPGSQITQLTSAGDNEDPGWAADGRHIVYSGSGAGRDGLYVIDTVTGNSRLLVQGGRLRTADWSPSLAALVGTN